MMSHFFSLFREMDWLVDIGDKSFSVDALIAYADLGLSMLMSWIFIPVWMAFVLPSFTIVILYISAFFVFMYGQYYNLKGNFRSSSWDVARLILAKLWYIHGRLWHGYEVEGLENIPNKGRALLIYYHGALPIDHYYLLATVYLKTKRAIHPVGDRFLFRIPGWGMLMRVTNVITGTVQTCAEILKNDELLSIAPGGVLEAQFGDENYELLWGNRVGFARVALESQSPIIPVFTENVREAYRTVNIGKRVFHRLYLKCRVPFVPIFGGFPVKLRTIIGKPIPYDQSVTAEELALATSNVMRSLILKHQRIPGSIFNGLMDRVTKKRKRQ